MSVKVKKKRKSGPKGPWIWTEQRLNQLAEEMEVWADIPGNTMMTKFCAEQGVYVQQLSEFRKTNQRLSLAIKKVKSKECHFLEKSCLYEGFTDASGKFRKVSTTGAIFLLKNNHGYTDNKDSGKDDSRQILNYITKNYSKNGGKGGKG